MNATKPNTTPMPATRAAQGMVSSSFMTPILCLPVHTGIGNPQ